MPWAAAAAVGAVASAVAKDGPAELPALIEKPNCEGCGAPTVPHAAVCAYCNRPKEAPMLNWFRRTAKTQTPLQVSRQAQLDQMRRRLVAPATPTRPAARVSSPAPAYTPTPTPDYSAPFVAAALANSFSSPSSIPSDSGSSSCSVDTSVSSGGGGDFGGGGASGEY